MNTKFFIDRYRWVNRKGASRTLYFARFTVNTIRGFIQNSLQITDQFDIRYVMNREAIDFFIEFFLSYRKLIDVLLNNQFAFLILRSSCLPEITKNLQVRLYR